MGLTKIEFHLLQSEQGVPYVAVNPLRRPGSFVLALSLSPNSRIGAQLATTLALEHFRDGALEMFGTLGDGSREDQCALVLEQAFRTANRAVYEFGHKLVAGGRMGASLVGMIVHEGSVSVGRVGGAEVYLVREGNLFSFFEDKSATAVPVEELVGSRSLVSVELASVRLEPFDQLLTFAPSLGIEERNRLKARVVESMDLEIDVRGLLTSNGATAALVEVGPNSIYLR